MDKPLVVGKVVDPVVAEREESGGGSSSGSGQDDDDDDEDGSGSGGKGGVEILLAKASNNTLKIPEVTLISERHLHDVKHFSLQVESLRGRLCDDETRAEIRRLSRRMEACGVGRGGRVAREGEALEGECREVVQRCREQEEGEEEEERGTAADADAQPVIKGPEADKRKVLVA